jgi:two-component system, chemotaxis family, CheB/CheR fusion protein
MLSHELRNPLSAIVTAVGVLKTRASSGSERILETLERQSKQMTRLLEDLLETSRVTQDKIELRKVPCDLTKVAQEAADAVRSLMDARGVALRIEHEHKPLIVNGDPARLQQIQVNLLNNAAKYTPRGGHVALRLAREGSSAIVRVWDDGAGIPANMLDAVFELFVQSDRTLDRAEGGLGVGLTLVRSLVGMHGGRVTAHSDGVGKGSEFVVELPLAMTQNDRPSDGHGLPVEAKRGLRIVIVEDNDDSREMLAAYLQNAGFECEQAANGAEGLALIEASRPDAAIVDIGLPGMSGLDVARKVRGAPLTAGIRLLALTGYGQAADAAAAREAGFDGHMVKPVALDQLLVRLSDAPADGASRSASERE